MKHFGEPMIGHDEGGWTLLELMVVLLIIAVLLAIAVGVYTGATGTANAAACRENQGVLNRAVAVAQAGGTDIDEMADLESCVVNFDRASVCPSDGTPLLFDAGTDTVTCPNHP